MKNTSANSVQEDSRERVSHYLPIIIYSSVFLVSIFTVTQISHAQTKNNAAQSRSAAPSSSFVKAQRDWLPFYQKFLKAVKEHDKASLKPIMVPEFSYSFGGNLDRDEAFAYWDQVQGWHKLEKVLAAGISGLKRSTSISDGSRGISRFAPLKARNRRYIDWRAIFEYGTDGNWRLAAFVAGD